MICILIKYVKKKKKKKEKKKKVLGGMVENCKDTTPLAWK
jgi:hypothetical protein